MFSSRCKWCVSFLLFIKTTNCIIWCKIGYKHRYRAEFDIFFLKVTIAPLKNSKCNLFCYMNVFLNALTLLDLALNIVVTQKHYFVVVTFV